MSGMIGDSTGTRGPRYLAAVPAGAAGAGRRSGSGQACFHLQAGPTWQPRSPSLVPPLSPHLAHAEKAAFLRKRRGSRPQWVSYGALQADNRPLVTQTGSKARFSREESRAAHSISMCVQSKK